ncbi:hypothetical protein MIMGU_mgv1a022781mg, partial [Erythranthe guttata]
SHVVLPDARGIGVHLNNFSCRNGLFTGQWNLYAQNPDSTSHLFGTSQGAGTTILTLLGGFHRQTQSLWLTDMAHHHLAIAFIFLVAGHMYRTNFGIGHCIKDLLDAHIPPGGRLGRGHTGLYDTINNSLHFQLGLALASLGVITSLVAQHMYSLPADTMPMTHGKQATEFNKVSRAAQRKVHSGPILPQNHRDRRGKRAIQDYAGFYPTPVDIIIDYTKKTASNL